MYCSICGDDDHSYADCGLYLGNHQAPDQAGLLPQHRQCWTCGQITHAWDHQPCGQHSVPGADMPVVDAPPVTPPRDRTHDLRALALAQAAEARAAHPDLDAWFAQALSAERRQLRLPVPDIQPEHDDPAHDSGPQHDSEQHQA